MNPKASLTPEILVSRTGEYLVQRGMLTYEQLQQALDAQKSLRAAGQSPLIGQVLIDMGMIDRPTLDQAITEQIFKLKTALQETNQQLERRVQERTAELQMALKKLSELNQLKSNIIANVSHELRTPMTHIKGYLELLATEVLGPVNAEQVDALKVMQKSSDRLENLIEDLISYSLTSKGEFTLRLATIDIKQICQSQVNKSMSAIEQANLSLKLHITDKLPKVKADEEKIAWVVNQLIENAIKFTPAKGQIIISANQENEFIKVSVTDSGIGIPKEKIPEIFEPFHQLDGTSTRRYGGTGLGLALVRQIIESHGSIIRVYSRVGQGSRFEFLLPCGDVIT
ncbi:MAG TPA: ATP-binding protein [Anaerolineaceae bacterium]|jgi:two-component system, OmpR family, phosphate regulon sensor histidine kinase PhoR